MIRRLASALVVVYLLGAAVWVVSAGVVRETEQVELLNVACDPTRELWRDLNARFIAQYQAETGATITIRQSHGGSGSQARAVIDGLDGDVVTLALWTDTDAIRKAGSIHDSWEAKFPNRSLPFTSTIVFVVRKGNPKDIHDWSDLARQGDDAVSVITPNPKTSGNGKWSFLAMWGSITNNGGSEAEAIAFVRQVFKNVPILDTAARGSTMTFAQKGKGDVHLTWENEAYLEVHEADGNLEIVYPASGSVLAEPHVALVDRVVERKGTKAQAEAYMKFLYTEEAQEVIAKHYYRPTNPIVQKRTAQQFPPMKLFPVRDLGYSWDEIQKKFFAENGVFDQIYASGRTS